MFCWQPSAGVLIEMLLVVSNLNKATHLLGLQLYTSLKRTVNLSDFEDKFFSINACLLSRLSQTGMVQTKAEKIVQNMR